ncbi:MAG: hypothetical protein V3T72_11185 [Thermoanaerobaculia bacterium]
MKQLSKLPLGQRRWLTAAVFVAALAARLFFWQATPDRGWPHSAVYKGDAVTWVEWANAIETGKEFELGLPIRPPGNAYLLAALGVTGPETLPRGKLVWCLLGALAVTGFFVAARAAFGLRVALIVAAWTGFSTALMGLSSSLNNETPYLALIAVLLLIAARLREQPSTEFLAAWGAVNGITCLFRVEHLLFVVLVTLWLTWRWWDADKKRSAKKPAQRLAWIAAAFAAVLIPWHAAAWREIDRFNTREPRLEGPAESAQTAIEGATSHLEWTPGARSERDRLPAFLRRSMGNFVAATVMVRGGMRVTEESFESLDGAFGYRPEALSRRPFVALYGPLNFYLAHGPRSAAGFRREALDRPPDLAGGAGRYPRMLLAGLPPNDLTFAYPPHLEAVNHGYGMGLSWIRENPAETLGRTWERLWIFWQGASGGWTGWGLPCGSAGVRRAVDLAVPTGGEMRSWRLALLAVCGLGIWRGSRSPELVPWLLILATKLAATVLFFGYARHGATCVPVIALLAAVAILGPGGDEKSSEPRITAATYRKWRLGAVVAAVLALGLELYRAVDPPRVLLDGQGIENGDPFPVKDHQDRRLEYARGK